MPSDLQRVARGLVECLDEVPQVVAHLHRTAERCRENAALAIAASHGQATVAAQQLDAAARACEQAAHYLSMAPPKAKAWAERLVGGSRSSDRPDAQSADRNRATGGSSDVAERDLFGRVTRTSLPFKPLEDTEGKEPPLITVARKAFEKLRKQQQKAEEEWEEPEEFEVEVEVARKNFEKLHKQQQKAEKEREQPEEFEVEITVAESGEIEVVDQEPPEERDYEIKVELDAAAAELLKSMEEHGKRSWTAATILIAPDRVTGTFTYPDDAPPGDRPPAVIDVHLPEPTDASDDNPPPQQIEVPEIDAAPDEAPDFDPAFHPRALGDDFMPGVHDPSDSFEPKEQRIAERMVAEGWRVDARPADHGSAQKNPDAMVRKSPADEGLAVEFKTPESSGANALKSAMLRARKQADVVVIDGRPTNLSADAADRAYRRCRGQPGVSLPRHIHVILGDGRLISYSRSADGGQ